MPSGPRDREEARCEGASIFLLSLATPTIPRPALIAASAEFGFRGRDANLRRESGRY